MQDSVVDELFFFLMNYTISFVRMSVAHAGAMYSKREVYMKKLLATVVCLLVVPSVSLSGNDDPSSPYAVWKNGPSSDPGYFPIAVWLQDPADANAYKEAGVNLYVGLWEGPTEKQLALLREAGMQTICHQNDVGLKYIGDSVIIGWMHGDEPDNAQRPIVNGQWSPPVLPEKIIADYRTISRKDPSRPVLLNLGQSVAWNNYIGRGVRRNHPEDYPEYAKGSDIVSFDIYPVTSSYPETSGNLWLVPRGVERLLTWTNHQKVVWNCIETTKIRAERRATPHELRAEVWMSIVHGSRGIIYFVHEWAPETDTRRLLNDPEMLDAVTKVNAEIRDLAPVVNSPTFHYGAEVTPTQPEIPVDVMVKRYGGAVYVFSCGMRNGSTDASFLVSGLGERAVAEVLGENRTVEIENGSFTDSFEPWDVHIYRCETLSGE